MKKIFGFITLGLLVVAVVGNVYAQPGVGATYIGDYSKMQSKESADKEMENANWIYRLQNLKNSKFSFEVTMKDNSVRAIRSKIYVDSVNNKTYLLNAESKQKIYCNQTQKISRGDAVTGMATDSCWLFKIVSGKINAYSFLSENAGPFSLAALQSGDGPIKNFDARLLEQMIADNPKAMKPFLKKDYLKAIEKFNGDNK